jgi:hypothetical protein
LKFEAVDLPGEDEIEETIERKLGFEGGFDRHSRDELPADEEEFENPLADGAEDAQ